MLAVGMDKLVARYDVQGMPIIGSLPLPWVKPNFFKRSFLIRYRAD